MRKSIILLCLVFGWWPTLWAQISPATGKATFPGKEEYFVDPTTQKLMIDVHAWGEVTHPGVYRVPLGTNVLELISQAGGPTEYSNLSRVKLTHREPSGSSRVETVDLPYYLDAKSGPPIPVLGPGDVVTVPRNIRHAWENSIKLVGDILTVASLFYLISQIQKK
jgi:hypothetical protein